MFYLPLQYFDKNLILLRNKRAFYIKTWNLTILRATEEI